MNKTLAIITLTTTFSMADIIGGELNIGYYNHTPSGTAQYKGDILNLESHLQIPKNPYNLS